jgi:glycosidase
VRRFPSTSARACRTIGQVRRPPALPFLALLLAACAPSAPSRPDLADWRDRVIYEIVTDRFANGDPGNDTIDGVGPMPGALDRWQGGDWRGIRDHLDHVQRLGASAIWISPIVRNVPRMDVADGYHGYWAAEPTELEPHFGTLDDLLDLVASAHARGIAVIVDIVPNHVGRVFDYDLNRNGAVDAGESLPPFADAAYDAPLLWSFTPHLFAEDGSLLVLDATHFHRRGIGDLGVPIQRRYGDFPDGLRDLDTESEAVIAAEIATYAHWARVTGVDGFRIDAVPHVDVAFWPRFASGLRAALAGVPHFYLLGEVFDQNAVIASYTSPDGSIDGAFDIPLWEQVVSSVVLGGHAPADGLRALSTDRAMFRTTGQPGGVGLDPWQARVSIVDSHDLPRVHAGTDPFAADQAIVLQYMVDAIPCTYYGTEAELTGGEPPADREPMWESGWDESTPTFALIHRLAELRRAHPALRRGALVVRALSTVGGAALDTTQADAGALVFERVAGGDHVLVALGTHPTHAASLHVDTGFATGTMLVDALGATSQFTVGAEGGVDLVIDPRSSLILVAR